MSLWDAASKIANSAKEGVNELVECQNKASAMSDDELIKTYKGWSTSSNMKRAAGAELSKRGYRKDEI